MVRLLLRAGLLVLDHDLLCLAWSLDLRLPRLEQAGAALSKLPFHSTLALFASYECGISSADNYSTHGSAAGVACLLHWDTSALGRVLCLLGSGLPQLSALSE